MRQPDGSIKIITQQFLAPAPAPVVKPAENKITVIKMPDGKLKVSGLQPGQQLIQLPDGKYHVTSAKQVVARQPVTPGTPQQQIIMKPTVAGAKTVIQKIVTPGAPNILQKTPQAKIIAGKVEGQVTTTPGQQRVVTTTSLQQLLAQNPGQKIVINQGTPNQRIIIANPSPQGQTQQQILVQQPGGQVVQQILLNTGQRIIASPGTPVKALVHSNPNAVQYQNQAPAQAATPTTSGQQTQEMNGNVAQQLLQGKLRMINHNGQQVLIKPLPNNQALIVAHVKPQENGPAQIVMTQQGVAIAGGGAVQVAGGGGGGQEVKAEGDNQATAAEEGASSSVETAAVAPGTPTTKTITAQVLQTSNGPRIMLSGIGQNELSPQQISELQQQVKEMMLKSEFGI